MKKILEDNLDYKHKWKLLTKMQADLFPHIKKKYEQMGLYHYFKSDLENLLM